MSAPSGQDALVTPDSLGNNRLQQWRRILETRAFLLLCVVAMRWALEAAYVLLVNPYFEYAGFTLNLSVTKYIEAWIILVVLTVIAPSRVERTSDYLVVYLLVAVILPLLSFFALSDQPRGPVYSVLLGYLLILWVRRGPGIAVPRIAGGFRLALILAGLGAATVSAWMVGSGGLRYLNFDFGSVYDFRRASGEVTGRFGFQYLNVWATKVFGPFLLAVSLWRRWWPLAAAVLFLHLLWFGISAHKSVVFYPLLVGAVWFWVRRVPATGLIPLSLAVAVVAAVIVSKVSGDIMTGSLAVRRAFFVISNNTFAYFEFFSYNQNVWWSNSVLSWLSEYPYDLGPARLIGAWRGTDSWVNNTFLSTGYMHAGHLGVAIYGVLVGFLFRLIDSLSTKGPPVWVCIAVVIVPMHSLLTSADLFTALLTHGVGLSIILLFLARDRHDVGVSAGMTWKDESGVAAFPPSPASSRS